MTLGVEKRLAEVPLLSCVRLCGKGVNWSVGRLAQCMVRLNINEAKGVC